MAKKNKIYPIFAVAIVCGIALGVAIFNSQPIIDQLRRWDVLPEADNVTELYFAKPTYLPDTYSPSQPVNFDFVVSNRTSASQSYTYNVVGVPEHSMRADSFIKSSVDIPPGQQITQSVALPVAQQGRVKIEVSIPDLNQSIHFWVNEK